MPKWVLKKKVKEILDARLMSDEERELFRKKEKAHTAKIRLKDQKRKTGHLEKVRKYLIERARQGEAAGPGPKPFKTKQK